MRVVIYEYKNDLTGICFSDSFVRYFDGLGCFELEAEIPDELAPYITVSGNIAIIYEGRNYMLNEVLFEKNGGPWIQLPSGFGLDKKKLNVYSRKEKSTAMHL